MLDWKYTMTRTPNQYRENFSIINSRLKALDAGIPEWQIVSIMLGNLPSSWESFVRELLDNARRTALTLIQVEGAIVQEADQRQTQRELPRDFDRALCLDMLKQVES